MVDEFDEIDHQHGYVDKYIGDGLMVLFGLSADREIHPCVDAVRAAVGMQQRMPELNKYLSGHLGYATGQCLGRTQGALV